MVLASRPIFAAPRVRALRRRLAISQTEMATDLGISVSYLSQIESGDRPLTASVLARLASVYPADWGEIEPDDEAALLVRMTEACNDPSAGVPSTDAQEIQRLVRQQPAVAKRMIALHQAFRHAQEQLRVLDDQVDTGSGTSGRLPWEEVRDWFHREQNYVEAIDRQAEALAIALPFDNRAAAIQDRLKRRHGVSVEPLASGADMLREYDPKTRKLRLNPAQAPETNLFSLACQLGQLEFAESIGAIAGSGTSSEAGRELLSAGLVNYAAGALLMPYEAFRQSARACRHDVDLLRQRFGTSFEQTCHRLSTLQRPGAMGLPVFFCRVDMAGNITKRHSATALQFARFGGACPLWIVHEAVAIPDRILVQLAETPDGNRYISMAKGLVKPSGSYSRLPRRYAVALGCEERHANEFVYADAVRTGGIAARIGTSCRICPRRDCEQRAFPPAASEITMDSNKRGPVPYFFSEILANPR